ncbi:uncharacterized protein EI90DRAFT_3019914 [Cantharellus anzutake]|uniref:uncharacterized protein n=1 Tax=Cantharellus anzutake TaxID=1750568 RepID=UPI001908595C|nr:uncharacterized protein EI90DRAFT_3019914 [Cantharellus anzutake]KAF8322990.1 hypothetical protein EI90DRAFT_3019914 [Cantharellus anzutake]
MNLHPEGNPPEPGPTVHTLQKMQSAPLLASQNINNNMPTTTLPFMWPGMNSGTTASTTINGTSSGYFMLPNNGILSTPTPTNYHQSVGGPMYIQNSLMTSGAPSHAQSFGYEVSSPCSIDQGLTNAHGQDVGPAHYAAHHGPSHSKESLAELIETLVQQKVEETLAQHLDKTNEKAEEGAVDNGTHQNKTRKGKWPPKGQVS